MGSPRFELACALKDTLQCIDPKIKTSMTRDARGWVINVNDVSISVPSHRKIIISSPTFKQTFDSEYQAKVKLISMFI
jgi:hypothetical protein